MSATEQLAQFALSPKLSALPSDLVKQAKGRILDTVGVTLAGSIEDCTRIAADVAYSRGSESGCTVLGFPFALRATEAAFVNGVGAHALEYDDITSTAVTHTSACIVPGVLSLAEELGRSGQEVLEAFVVGFEVATRIGLAMRKTLLPRGWHPNGVLGVIGVAAAGARLLKLTQTQTCCALGIAASCSSGIRKNVGSMTKPFHVGHAASDGILAAKLAAKGFTADADVFSIASSAGTSGQSAKGHGAFSFFEVFAGSSEYNLDHVVRALGESFELSTDSTITRFHPGSTFPQGAIDEIIDLVVAHDLRAEQISDMRVGVTPACRAIAPYGIPDNGLYARFSAPYTFAVAAIDREVAIRQYDDERVRAQDVQTLLRKVDVYIPDEFRSIGMDWDGSCLTPISCIVEIRCKDGKIISGRRDTTKGYPGTETTWDDLAKKYKACAIEVLSPEAVDLSLEGIESLESCSDIGKLLKQFRVDAR
jgi:2-methylcitrate dehydratase PrpD